MNLLHGSSQFAYGPFAYPTSCIFLVLLLSTQPQPQQKERQSSIMSCNVNERTYIMVKVRLPYPPSLTNLLTTKTVSVILSHRSPMASSEV